MSKLDTKELQFIFEYLDLNFIGKWKAESHAACTANWKTGSDFEITIEISIMSLYYQRYVLDIHGQEFPNELYD